MTNETEVLELAKKCVIDRLDGIRDDESHGYYYEAWEEQFLAFAAALENKMISDGWRQCANGQRETHYCAQAVAIEEKHQAQIAILNDIFTSIAGGLENCIESAKLNRDDYTVGYMVAMLDEARRALSFTQQSSEAFLAEVRAKAKLEGKIEALTDAAGELMKRPDYVAPSLRANMVTVHVTSESNAELLLHMASELREQPEVKCSICGSSHPSAACHTLLPASQERKDGE